MAIKKVNTWIFIDWLTSFKMPYNYLRDIIALDLYEQTWNMN